ncbi:MAG: hypothetical protein ACK5WS_04855 [Alphaproteobacteria bacterium]
MHVSSNGLNIEFCNQLSQYLLINSTLVDLALNESGICDCSLYSIVKALHRNTNLQVLNLSANNITDKGIENLSNYLAVNKALRVLKLGWNEFGDQGVKHLCSALKGNGSLTSLELYSNKISHLGVKEIVDLLSSNTSLTRMRLSDNTIRNKGAIAFALCLKSTTSLREINLSYNGINNRGAIAFAKAVKHNMGLIKFSLKENEFNKEASQKLDSAVIANKNILYAFYDYRSEDVSKLLSNRVERVRKLIVVWSGDNIDALAFQNTGLFAYTQQMKYLSTTEGLFSEACQLEYSKHLHDLMYRSMSMLNTIFNIPFDIRKEVVSYLSDEDKESLWTVICSTKAVFEYNCKFKIVY